MTADRFPTRFHEPPRHGLLRDDEQAWREGLATAPRRVVRRAAPASRHRAGGWLSLLCLAGVAVLGVASAAALLPPLT